MRSRRIMILLGITGLAACSGGGGGGSAPPIAPAVVAPSPTPTPGPPGAVANVNSSPLTFAKPVNPAAPPLAMSGDVNAGAILAKASLGERHAIGLRSSDAVMSNRRAPRTVIYPDDLPYNGGTVISSAQIHPVYIQTFWDNCSLACWGNPQFGISDLAASNFMHIVDPYVGYSQANRYTLGTGAMWSLSPLPTNGNPVIGESQILLLLYYTAYSYGTGYNHIYHVFLPPNIDVCWDRTAQCYSPDNRSTFSFCGYHSSANFGTGPIIYSVLGYADVPGCRIVNGPNASGGHDIVDSTMDIMSHETFEIITDPEFKHGWYSSFLNQEIGDLCRPLAASTTLNGFPYFFQTEYSNFYHGCTNTP